MMLEKCCLITRKIMNKFSISSMFWLKMLLNDLKIIKKRADSSAIDNCQLKEDLDFSLKSQGPL